MKKIITADNTETFLNSMVGESYHSQTGAVEEALKKYAIPCKIAEKAMSGKLRILDMYFGMGYNSAMAIDVALKANPNCVIEVIGVENDPEIIAKIQEVNPPIAFFQNYKKLSSINLQFTQNNVTVKILLGDSAKMLQKLDEEFDAIFYDPFSPKTMPELWTKPLFEEMWRLMNQDAILATYSCARVVRDNMSSAGLMYEDGPIVGRRGPGTIATKWI
jgi:chorismate dehydratase